MEEKVPRGPRKFVESEIYHVIIRGNNRQNIFFDDYDRNLILNKIKKYSEELEISIFAYCLMNNHVHLLVGKANKYLSKFMLKLNTSYSRLFNIRYERSGHLFQGRYMSNPIETDNEFQNVFRYILQNPEKAGLCKTENFKWSSYRFHELPEKTYIIDNSVLYSLFPSKTELYSFIKTSSNEQFMDYESKITFSDNHCISIIYKIAGTKNPHKINRMDKIQMKIILRELKSAGISINKISRLTGISRKIIKSA